MLVDDFSSQMVSPQYWADTAQCLNPYSDNVDGIWSTEAYKVVSGMKALKRRRTPFWEGR